MPDVSALTQRAATTWAGRSIRAMGVAAQVGLSPVDAACAVWGLGQLAAGSAVPERPRQRAVALRKMLATTDPADLASAADLVLGLMPGPPISDLETNALRRSAELIDAARRRRSEWPVFAERLSSTDVRVARALVVAGRGFGDDARVARGVESIEWLARRAGLTTTADGMWHPPTAGPQLCVDAAAFVESLVDAHVATGEAVFGRMAQQAMSWFLGANVATQAVLDQERGACRIGLGPSAAFAEPTAVATLAYLGAALALRSAGLATLPVVEVARQDLAAVA
jgi:hypothetical protein